MAEEGRQVVEGGKGIDGGGGGEEEKQWGWSAVEWGGGGGEGQGWKRLGKSLVKYNKLDGCISLCPAQDNK